jgi:hypothetical protein
MNMRGLFLALIILHLSFAGTAQWKNYIISVKGDTLNRLDMKDRKQGPWVVHVDNVRGERGYEEEGFFVNSKKEGVWRRYSLEGDLLAIETYRWGGKDGKNVYFTPSGPLREENWRAVNPDNPYDTVNVFDPNDPSKIVAKQVVKLEGYSLKHGAWKYYDSFSGRLDKTEYWYFDKPAKKTGVFDDELAPIAVTDNEEESSGAEVKKKTVTKPKEILEYEKKNSNKKKIKVRDGATGG